MVTRKLRFGLPFIALVLAILACSLSDETPTEIPTETPVPTPSLAVAIEPTVPPTNTPVGIGDVPTRLPEATATQPTTSNEQGSGPLNCPISGTNLLTNASFEAPYESVGAAEFNVANGWFPWFFEAGENFAPEYKPADPQFAGRVIDGATAQVYFKSFGRFVAGVGQVVLGLEPGARYQFSVYGHGWSCEDFNQCKQGQSFNPANMNMRVGIDTSAGRDGRASGITYSPFQNVLDSYQIFCVDAVATSDRLTVFTYAAPDGPRQNQDIYWDNAALIKAP